MSEGCQAPALTWSFGELCRSRTGSLPHAPACRSGAGVLTAWKNIKPCFCSTERYRLERFFYRQAVTDSELSVHKIQNHCSSLVKGRLTFSGYEFNPTFLFILDRSCFIADDYWNSASAFEIAAGCYESKTE